MLAGQTEHWDVALAQYVLQPLESSSEFLLTLTGFLQVEFMNSPAELHPAMHVIARPQLAEVKATE